MSHLLRAIVFRSELSILVLSLALATVGYSGGSGGSGVTPAALSSNANLARLVVSAGDFSPLFDTSTTSYTLDVGNSVSFSTVSPTTSDATASITVNGVAVTTGTPSPAIRLAAAGMTDLIVVVTAEDGISTQTYTVTVTRFVSLELIDPTPRAGDMFGTNVTVLGNGNIVVSDDRDSRIVTKGGAVHLYSPLSSTPIASIYGDIANDSLGIDGIIALANNNFVVVSAKDDEGGIVDAGSVRLFNGTTGVEIGTGSVGDTPGDRLGFGGVIALANNNFVIASPGDDEGGIVNAGSVRLVSGTTGAQIGAAIVGDTSNDELGLMGITALANNNFVIISSFDSEGGISDVGSVRLVSGSTGVQIGPALVGDVADDHLGRQGVTPLANSNFVVASADDDEGGIVDAGSVQLVSGTTGTQIGPTLAGDVPGDWFGLNGITPLGNNNFVVSSAFDQEGGLLNAGSVRLVSGTTGLPIGAALVGNKAKDLLGIGGITALANNNFVVASPKDDVAGIINAGSVQLISGTTGVPIGTALVGNQLDDQLGLSSVTALANNNFVVASADDNVGGMVNAGSVQLIDGTTGAQIGPTLAGDKSFDGMGFRDVTALVNNNFVVTSDADDEGGISDVGSVRLFSGTTGVQIGASLVGNNAGDSLGSLGVTLLANDNFIVASSKDNEGGVNNVGSVRLVSGTTGAQIGAPLVVGNTASDIITATVTLLPNGEFSVLAFRFWDNGLVNSGRVLVIAK